MTTADTQQAGFSPQRLSRVDNLLERYVEGGYLAGALGLIYRKGKIAYCRAFGQRDLESALPMTEDTIFRIYSMTKPITSVAVLMLFEDGHFLLDDPVSSILPEFAGVQVCTGDLENLVPPDRPPTIKDLLMHTAGLSYGWGDDSPVEKLYFQNFRDIERHSLEPFVTKLAALPLLYHPGTRWRYSRATDVLGRLIEVVSGKLLDEFFQREIFQPLSMADTGFHVPARSVDRFAACYCPPGGFKFGSDLASRASARPAHRDGEKERAQPLIELYDAPGSSRYTKPPAYLSGGGGLVSTLGDYLRFCQMLLNEGVLDGNRLLGRKTVELMRANHLPPNLVPIEIGDGQRAGHGFGLGMSALVDPPAYSAPGSVGTYAWGGLATTRFWIDPVEELVGLLMTQFIPSDYYTIEREFSLAVYQALVD